MEFHENANVKAPGDLFFHLEPFGYQLSGLGAWIRAVKAKLSPCKEDQDGLDACICLLVALSLIEPTDGGLMVGDTDTGYIVVPHTGALRREFEECCRRTDRDPPLWVRVFTLNTNG